MAEWTAAEAAALVGGRLAQGEPEQRLAGVATDSRRLAAGTLFFALSGERFDGHDFCAAAVDAGAAGVVVSRRKVPVPQETVVITVDDPLLALGRLAAVHRRRLPCCVLAVTGSVGKSTTKQCIAAILERVGETVAAPENYNNEIGLPLTLLQLKGTTRYAVVELAMRGRGQLKYLCGLARPKVGVVTNVGVSHLELLGSVENLVQAKAELVAALPADGTAVLGVEGDHFSALAAAASCPVLTFGFSENATVRAVNVGSAGPARMTFDLVVGGEHVPVKLPAPGRHNVLNAAAAAAACYAVGVAPADLAAGLEQVSLPPLRLESVPTRAGVTVLADCYNAAPESVRAALEVAREWTASGRRLAVLGDMKELGPDSPRWHREIGRLAVAAGFTHVLAVGDYAAEVTAGAVEGGLPSTTATAWSAVEPLVAELQKEVRPGDLVLVKGSRALHLERVVEALRND